MLFTILIVLLILALLGGPWFPYARGWGYGPSGAVGVIIVILLILILLGYR